MKKNLRKALGGFLCLAVIIGAITIHASAAELPILMYHHLTTDETQTNSMTITEERFRLDMEFLKEYGYTALLPADLIAIQNGTLDMPEKPIVITFDDGYASNYTMAYPILLENDMKAAIAVITANMQNEETYDPEGMFMSWKQIAELSQSPVIEIGLHTHNLHNPHAGGQAIINGVNGVERLKGETQEQYAARVGTDLKTGLQLIREHTGVQTINYFSYPYGASDKWMEQLLTQNNVAMSTTTTPKMANITNDLRLLPRYRIEMHKSVSQMLQVKTNAQPSSVQVVVGDAEHTLQSYNINGNNYVRVRDVAAMLKDTTYGFDVTWDAQRQYVQLVSDGTYTPLGTEGQALAGGKKTVKSIANPTVVDNETKMIAAYNIDGNTYYKLRSLGDVCDFQTAWDDVAQKASIS